MDVMKKVPVREQDPKVRATNFEEVCYGYNEEEAVAEAERCLNCKNARCVEGCPVNIDIPTFIREVKERKFEDAANTIALSSALPAVCGRVCPQESQCEGKCIRGIKGESISIGKLERFVADYAIYSSLEASIPRCRTVLDDEQSRFPCWEACPFLKRPQLPQMAMNTLHFLPERASPRAQRGRIVLQVGGNLRVARRRRRQAGRAVTAPPPRPRTTLRNLCASCVRKSTLDT